MKFIGRINEIEKIIEIINNQNQENLLLYGRRRIGKTFLIRRCLEGVKKTVIHYQCKNINIESMLDELNEIVCQKFNLEGMKFKTIDLLLDFLFRQHDVVLSLDEYCYLHNSYKPIDSIIQNKIDTYKDSSNLKLIITGSLIDVMEKIIQHSYPLYGRFNNVMFLKEENYYDSSKYYDTFSNEDKVTIYSVFGGEPFYNSKINPTKTAIQNIIDLVVKEDSLAELTIKNLLIPELNRLSYSNEVLQLIASGVRKHQDLNDKAYVNDTSKLTNILNKLISMDLIEKVTPINDEFNKKKTFYYIKNKVLNFYYKYVYANLTIRTNVSELVFFDKFIKDDFFNSYIPFQFEGVVKEYLIIKNKQNFTNPFYKIGTYWYDDKINKINGQFDVVTFDDFGYTFYEVKYRNSLIDIKIVEEEIQQLEKIGINYTKLGFVSKKGFNLDENDYILYTLDDIYK